MNLRAMETLKKAFPNTVVGLSDHTMGIHISVAAVAMGAKVIEKHFTLSRKMEGPDHPFAIEPDELKEMVRQIRDVEAALGDGQKTGPCPEEMENYRIGRRSIHARIDIPKGTLITQEMLIVKRPGLGIHPRFLDKLNQLDLRLSEGDKRQLMLIKLGFSISQSAGILGVGYKAIQKARQRLARKFQIESSRGLLELVDKLEKTS